MLFKKIRSLSVLCLFFVLALSNSAFAQRDAGQFQILQARYGTSERNIDVTQRLKELTAADRSFKMGNENFATDPHPGQVKTLRIFARDDNGNERTFEYREGSYIDGTMFKAYASSARDYRNNGDWGMVHERDVYHPRDEGEYVILQARYGTSERNVDVTQTLKQLAKQDRSFRMGNDSFGIDPHVNRVKTLRIFARGPNGQTRTFEYSEGSWVDGAQFKAWGGGNWGQRDGYHGGWDSDNQASRNADRYSQNMPSRSSGLIILSAHYGAGSNRQSIDVTQILQSQVRDGSLEMKVENSAFGNRDPAPNVVKTLTVNYSVNGGQPQQIRVEENDWLELSR